MTFLDFALDILKDCFKFVVVEYSRSDAAE